MYKKENNNIYVQAASYREGYEKAIKDLSYALKAQLPMTVHRDCSEIDYEVDSALYSVRGKIDRAAEKLKNALSFPDAETVERIRREFPKGTRVELMEMDDIQAPSVGTYGTVMGVDDIGSLIVHWDNGSRLHVVYGKDVCRRINENLLVILTRAAEYAVSQYDPEHIDAIYNEETGAIDFIYHSSSTSFTITGTDILFEELSEKDLKKLEEKLDELEIGHCW